MTTYYVGPGGNNGNVGTSWAQRKLTLNGAEDIPVAAGDTVYVGPGTCRELLTVDVAGSAGNPITYIGDYTGANTDGVGGEVRVTGSDNDQTATRAQCVNAPNARSYRTFRGFVFDTVTGSAINIQASSQNWIIEDCVFPPNNQTNAQIALTGTGTGHTLRRCLFYNRGAAINFTHSATVDNTGQLVENCIFVGSGSANGYGVRIDRVGGGTIKNCIFLGGEQGVRVQTALTAAQKWDVNNCLLSLTNTALQATALGEIVEDYNNLWGNATDRSTVNTGANSKTYPPLWESRWFFQLLYAGAGPNSVTQLISPFDLGAASQLINLAGTSPPTLDLRGTAAIGGTREWGPLEYDSTLKIAGSAGGGLLTNPGMRGGING